MYPSQAVNPHARSPEVDGVLGFQHHPNRRELQQGKDVVLSFSLAHFIVV